MLFCKVENTVGCSFAFVVCPLLGKEGCSARSLDPLGCKLMLVLRNANSENIKGLTLVQALRGRVGAKGCWRHFFKNPTTQLHVVWGLTAYYLGKPDELSH